MKTGSEKLAIACETDTAYLVSSQMHLSVGKGQVVSGFKDTQNQERQATPIKWREPVCKGQDTQRPSGKAWSWVEISGYTATWQSCGNSVAGRGEPGTQRFLPGGGRVEMPQQAVRLVCQF